MIKIGFPHLGDYHNPIGKLIKNITNLEVIKAPKITNKTIHLGSKESPDSVCLPFKYNLGNYIELLENGANVLLQAGGGCRYRYYAEVQETILKDLGYSFKFIQITGNGSFSINQMHKTFKELNPKLTRIKFIYEAIKCLLYIEYLDNIDKHIRKRIGFEKNKNDFYNLKENFMKECNKNERITTLTISYLKYKFRLKKIPLIKPKKHIKIGIIGELYTAMEPFATYELEKILAQYHVEIKRFTNLSYLLWKKKLLHPYIKFKTRKYCKYRLGADGLDNVYRTLWLKKHNFDGIIHTKPTGCTPEIGAIPIIMRITEEIKIPIIYLSFDEQNANEGLKTRIEAFYDLLKIRKENKK